MIRPLWFGLAVLPACFCLTNCATTPSAKATKVADADEISVAGCSFVGQVQGSPGWGNLPTSTGMENAKNEAREKAAKLGATDIVWRSMSAAHSPYVSGLAYDCSSHWP
jgi:hypothetical protein